MRTFNIIFMVLRRIVGSVAAEFSRRRFLISALGSGVTLGLAPRMFGAAQFWEAKDPSTWSEEEIRMLISNSPWAKAAVPNVKSANGAAGSSDDGGKGRGVFRNTSEKIVVRWESAQPILDALRAPAGPDFATHYIVSVTNLPIPTLRRPGPGEATTPDDTLDRMQNGATLEAKGRDPGEAGFARRTHISSILFGFSRDYLHLTPGDREIVFNLDTGQLTIRAKFDAKEMIYKGNLAL
jgi:hypothetical protein